MRRKPIFRWLLFQFLAVILLVAAGLIGGWFYFFFKKHLMEDTALLRGRFVEGRKDEIRWIVEEMVQTVAHERAEVADAAAREMRDRLTVLEAEMKIAMDGLAPEVAETFQESALHSLRQIRFDSKGVVLAVGVDGRVKYLTGHPEAAGFTVEEVVERYLPGSGITGAFIQRARAVGEASTIGGVLDEQLEPVDMLHAIPFAPLDWVICGYVSKAEQELAAQKRVLRRISRYRAQIGDRVFAGDWEGAVLAGAGVGAHVMDSADAEGRHIIGDIIELSRDGGGYLEHRVHPLNHSGQKDAPVDTRVDYVRGIPGWSWYVGASFHQSEIDAKVANALGVQRKAALKGGLWSIAAVLGALAVGGALAFRIADTLRREFRLFQEEFRTAGLGSGRMEVGRLATTELAEMAKGVNEMFEHRRASEERFLTMFQSCPMGILRYRLDESDRLLFVGGNPSAEKMLGLSLGDCLGWEILKLFPALAETEIPEIYRRIAREGGGWATDNVVYDDGRAAGTFEVFAFQSAPSEVAVFFVDVSERELSRRALRQSEERFRTIVETAYEGIMAAAADWRIYFVNRRLGELLGCDAEDIIGNRLDAFMHPGELADHAARMERREKGIAERYERRFIRRDGSVVTMLVSATPVMGEGGAFEGSFAMLVDISEQKRSAEVIASLARFPAENPSPVLRLSRRGVLLYANPGAKQLIEGLGASVGTQVPEPLKGLAFSAGHGGREFQIESGGRSFSMIATAMGSREYVNVYGYDVTEQRRLEEQVRQSQKMEAIGRLAGGVAHDFNNMLQAILGFVDVTRDYLTRGVDPDPALEEIEKAGKRAAELTRQLLAFGRRQMLRPRPVDLNEKISDLMKMLRRIISEDIEVEFAPSPEIGLIMADPVQIDQVLLNLAVNAKDAMPTGGRILIATADLMAGSAVTSRLPSLKPGRYVMLSFSDTGCGMTEEVQSHLFEPFFTTKAMGRGTGLGLATVYGIIGQHGGAIDVESEPESGTTFRMYFPVTQDRVFDLVLESGMEVPGGKETILLAEDDSAVRAAVRITLESAGYRVIEAVDGQEAVEILRSTGEEIEMALLDVVMPRMSGIEVQKVIAEEFPQLGVLFSSGYTAQDPQSDFITARGLELIQKPYDRDVLLKAVRRTLDARGQRPKGGGSLSRIHGGGSLRQPPS